MLLDPRLLKACGDLGILFFSWAYFVVESREVIGDRKDK